MPSRSLFKHDPRRDYGRLARIGVLTPQANPTVEPELQLLFPAGVSMLTSRCTSTGEPRQRFLDYFRNMERSLAGFDTLELDAVAFACTASSYLLEPGEEESECRHLEARFAYPLITAAAAIGQALNFLGAKRIALACPYPDWLHQCSKIYWQAQGFELVDSISVQPDMGDTRAIYDIRGEEAATLIKSALKPATADAIVITGTGMPALKALVTLQKQFGIPVFNSNLALAWACLNRLGIPPGNRAADTTFPLLSGWQAAL